jgi:hypothetical protein
VWRGQGCWRGCCDMHRFGGCRQLTRCTRGRGPLGMRCQDALQRQQQRWGCRAAAHWPDYPATARSRASAAPAQGSMPPPRGARPSCLRQAPRPVSASIHVPRLQPQRRLVQRQRRRRLAGLAQDVAQAAPGGRVARVQPPRLAVALLRGGAAQRPAPATGCPGCCARPPASAGGATQMDGRGDGGQCTRRTGCTRSCRSSPAVGQAIRWQAGGWGAAAGVSGRGGPGGGRCRRQCRHPPGTHQARGLSLSAAM